MSRTADLAGFALFQLAITQGKHKIYFLKSLGAVSFLLVYSHILLQIL